MFFPQSVMLSHSVVSDSLQPQGLQPTRLLCLWNFPGKNTGVGCHFLLQGFSQPRDWTCTHVSCVSCIAGGFFTHWVINPPLISNNCRSKWLFPAALEVATPSAVYYLTALPMKLWIVYWGSQVGFLAWVFFFLNNKRINMFFNPSRMLLNKSFCCCFCSE